MLFSIFTIKDTITRLNTLRGQIKPNEKEEVLSTYQGKFYAIAYDLALGLGEAQISLGDSIFKRAYSAVMEEIAAVQKAKSLEEFKEACDTIINRFKDFDYSSWNSADYEHNIREFIMANTFGRTYTLSSTRALTTLARRVQSPANRDITLFYPECGNGDNIASLNLVSEKLLSYGNEARDYDLSDAKTKMHKVVKGKLRGSRIQNNAFDIVYYQPQVLYEFDHTDAFFNKRVEKSYISDMFKYVRKDGLLILTMPYTRLFKDVCSMLARHLKNIQVFKVSEYEFNTMGLIHIVGQKDSAKETRADEYAKLRMLYDYNNVQSIEDIEEFEYALPRANTVIEIFKGSALDLEEVQLIVDNSTLMDKIWATQKVNKLDENIKNPLLPFNIGQLGLVLTSGCLDGVVDEGDGFKHLIKGRVSKYTMEVESDTDKGIEVTETTVNKVEINVLLPNGEFKVLA